MHDRQSFVAEQCHLVIGAVLVSAVASIKEDIAVGA